MRAQLARAMRATAGRMGFDLIRRSGMSPIPQPEDLEGVWERVSPLGGLRFDAEAQLAYLGRLSPHLAEFTAPPGFGAGNRRFGIVDAALLYAMIRDAKPRRVLEVGAGFSTLITAAACARNRAEGHAASFVSVDPHPLDFLRKRLDGLDELREAKATEIPLAEFAELEEDDVLFVDTTHTVKVGGDANYLILDALPVLRLGVLVHFHDIFLPYEYPRWLIERGRNYWAEQYLLQAFLAFNREFEVLFATYFFSRQFPERLAQAIPHFHPRLKPGSFWIRRLGA